MFHPELVSFLSLLKRTADAAGEHAWVTPGWKPFSDEVKPLVLGMNRKFPGLFAVDLENKLVCVTQEGEVLVKWMNYVPPNISSVMYDDEVDI